MPILDIELKYVLSLLSIGLFYIKTHNLFSLNRLNYYGFRSVRITQITRIILNEKIFYRIFIKISG